MDIGDDALQPLDAVSSTAVSSGATAVDAPVALTVWEGQTNGPDVSEGVSIMDAQGNLWAYDADSRSLLIDVSAATATVLVAFA